MTVAAIYARYSSDSQRDVSIEIQVEKCTDFATRHDWKVEQIYTDFAKTGRNVKRTGFQRMIEDAKKGMFDVLVFYKSDRFARNIEMSRHYKTVLKEAGIRIFSVTEGESTDTPESFLAEGMQEVIAEWYSLNLSRQIKNGIEQNAKKLMANGVRRFGYDVDETDHFIINEEQAAIVREMYERKLRGDSVNQISEWLEDIGCERRFGRKWPATSVARLLKNPAYMGTYIFGEYEFEDAIPAIVDKDTFHRVNELMNTRQTRKRRPVHHDYILSDKLYCLKCGNRMRGVSGTGKSGRKYTYYSCLGNEGCRCHYPTDKVEESVMTVLMDRLISDGSAEQFAEAMIEFMSTIPNRTKEYEELLRAVKKRKANLVKSIADGIPADILKDELMDIQSEIDDITHKLRMEQIRVGDLADPDNVRKAVNLWFERGKTDDARGRKIIENFVEKLYVDDEAVIAVLKFSDNRSQELTLDEIKALKSETPERLSPGVRLVLVWWSSRSLIRTLLLMVRGLFALVIPLEKD